jgi:RimJ/RimL family protein N-acetyltransferase
MYTNIEADRKVFPFMNVSIKQLTESDWRALSKIRLKALQTDPSVFGSNYEAEAKFTETDWRSRFDSDKTALFMLFEGETPVGMTGISVDRDDPTNRTAILWGSWLEPHMRGKGLSRMMYESRLNWANAHPTIERIIVSHRASNLSSKYANQKHGFSPTGITEKIWPDGVREEEFHYELKLP